MSKPTQTKLTRFRYQAITAILCSSSYEDAARKLGYKVSAYQLGKWMREDEAFRAACAEQDRMLAEHPLRRLQHAQFAAIDQLEKDVTNPDATVRFKAIKMLMEYGARYAERKELAERVAELERKQEAQALAHAADGKGHLLNGRARH